MGQIDAALNTILTNLQNTNGVTQAQYQAVYQAINDSPALLASLNADATSGVVTAINLQTGPGTDFDTTLGAINLNVSDLNSDISTFNTSGENDLIFNLAHEDQHGEDWGLPGNQPSPVLGTVDYNEQQAQQDLAQQISSSTGGLSSAAQTAWAAGYQSIGLDDEAQANIGGWNAVLSRAEATNGGTLSSSQLNTLISATPQAYSLFTNAGGQITTYAGITQNADGSIAATTDNIDAAANVVANIPTSTTGSAYSLFYGEISLGWIAAENNGKVDVSYSGLGLTTGVTTTGLNPSSGQGGTPLTSLQVDQDLSQYFSSYSTKSSQTFSLVDSDDSSTVIYTPTANSYGVDATYNQTLPAPATSVSSVTTDAGLNSAGGTVYEEVDTLNTNGILSSDVSGEGDVANLANAIVTASVNSIFTLNGSGNIVTAGSGATVTVQGNSNTVNTTDGTITCSAGDTGNVFDGDQTTINAGANFAGTVDGTDNSVYLTANSNSSLTLGGTDQSVFSTGNLTMTSAGTFAVITGANTIDLDGTDQSLTLETQGDTVEAITGDTDETLIGSDFTLNDTTGVFTGTVNGSNNTLSLDANSNSSVTLTGTGETISSTGNDVTLDGTGSSATITGANTIDVGGASQSLTLDTNGDTVDTSAGDTGEVLSGSGFTLDGAAGQFTGTVAGSNDIFDLDNNSSSSLTLTGTGESVTSTGNDVTLDGSSSITSLTGASNVVSLDGSNESITDNTPGNTIDAAANLTDDNITATGATIDLGSGSGVLANVGGSDDTVNLVSNGDATIGVNGTDQTVNSIGNTIDTGTDAMVTINGDTTVGIVGSGELLDLTTDGDTINTVANSTDNSITATDTTINGASGFSALLNGTDDTISLTSNSNSAMELYSTGDTVNATDDAVYLETAGIGDEVSGSGDKIGLNASGDDITMTSTGDTVDAVADSTGDLISGSDETIDGGSGFSALLSGTDNTVNLTANSGSGIELYSTGDTVNAADDAVYLDTASIAATVSGSGDKVGINTAGDTLSLSSSGDTVDAAANSTGDLISGTDETIDGGSGFSALLSGTDNTVNLTANSGSGVELYGTGDTVNTTDDAVYLNTAGISADVDGSGNKVGLNTDNDNLTLGSTGDTVDSTADATGETVTATDATINGGSGFSGNILGSDDTVQLVSNSSSYAGVYGTGQTIDSTGNSLNVGGSGSAVTLNGVDTIGLCNTGQQLTLDSTGDTVNTIASATGEVITGTDATINGSTDFTGFLFGADNKLNLTSSSDSSFALFGTGDTVSSTDNNIYLSQSGISDTVSGTNNTVTLQSSDQTISMNGDTVDADSGDKGDVIDGSYDTLNDDGTGSFTVDGNIDKVTGSDDQVSISGQDDTLDLSHTTIDVAGDDGVTIDGSDDKIVGGSGDTFTLDGTDDDVSATDSSITFDGSNSGDYVSGSGDSGSNWDDPSGGGGDGDPGSGYYGYGLTKFKGKNPSATQIAAAEHSDSVYEGAAWSDKTITWSFANATGSYSDAINNSAEQMAVEQAFQAWAKASGLNFNEVAAGTPSDIEVGFSDLNTASTNEIGLTKYNSQAGSLTGAQVELEDPNQASLTTNASGQLSYANTDATFEQVALHEIGHALGLADNDVAGSIMNGVLGSNNQVPSATDVSNIQSLYGTPPVSSGSSVAAQSVSQVHQLVQAMSAFDAAEAGIEGAIWDAGIPLSQELHAVASLHVSAHVA